MRQKTVITKLLQSVIEVYYKVRQVLQNASGITKCDSYYKVRRNTVTLCPKYHTTLTPYILGTILSKILSCLKLY